MRQPDTQLASMVISIKRKVLLYIVITTEEQLSIDYCYDASDVSECTQDVSKCRKSLGVADRKFSYPSTLQLFGTLEGRFVHFLLSSSSGKLQLLFP